MFSLCGPESREILQALSDADLSNEAFPFGAAQLIDVGYARCWAVRRSFIGELGFELYPTTDLARHVYEELLREGASRGMAHAGFLAINHCRLEKGFVHFGHDIGEDDTPLEAGLRFAVAFDKREFIGRDALLKQRDAGPTDNRLVNVRVLQSTQQDGPYLLRNEPIWKAGELVGYVTSGAWGFRLGGSFGMASVKRKGGVTAEWLREDGFEVEVAGAKHRIDLQFSGFYDPNGARMKS
jgi:4-methylaminobutanoate oxidase (formaldehyde-forming)